MKVLLLSATATCLLTAGLADRILTDSSGAALALFLAAAAVAFVVLERLIAVPSAETGVASA